MKKLVAVLVAAMILMTAIPVCADSLCYARVIPSV